MSQKESEGSREDDLIRHNLSQIYREVKHLDDAVVESLSPSFVQLSKRQQRYSEKKLIGEGALKRVYSAWDYHTQRTVAYAELKAERGLEFYDLFVHEAWLVSSLSHPNIIKVHDAGVASDGRPYFTMDLKSGESLSDRIQASNDNDLADLLESFNKICDAIAYAHSKGILHLDLKPTNIQCSEYGEVLVCDWGLGVQDETAFLDSDTATHEEEIELNLTGGIQGSPGYMAPEQYIPTALKTEASDVFALGCILHCILCGEPPPSPDSTDGPLSYSFANENLSLSKRYPNRRIPPSLEAVVLKATQLQTSERYATVLDLKRDIQKYQRGFATIAEQPGFFREAKLFVARNRLPSAIVVVALILISTLSVLFVQHLNREQLATSEERARADQLLSEVNVLNTDKVRLFEELSLSRNELATQLARAAVVTQRLGFYENPVKALNHADRLLKNASELSKVNAEVVRQRFLIQITRLNLKYAKSFKLDQPTPLETKLLKFARANQQYSFNQKQRPTWTQIEAMLRSLKEIDANAAANAIAEAIFSYHCATVANETPSKGAIEAYLNYLHRGRGQFEYSAPLAELRMRTPHFIVLRLRRENASKKISTASNEDRNVANSDQCRI